MVGDAERALARTGANSAWRSATDRLRRRVGDEGRRPHHWVIEPGAPPVDPMGPLRR